METFRVKIPQKIFADESRCRGLVADTSAELRAIRLLPARLTRDCVARVSVRPQFGHLASLLREVDVLRTPEFEHPVQCFDGNLDLGRSTLIGSRSKTTPIGRLKRLMSAGRRG